MLYRKEALARAGSPDELDRLLHVTSPRRWLVLAAFAALLLAGVAWSIVTSLNSTIDAAGGRPTGGRSALLLVSLSDAGSVRSGMVTKLICPLITAPSLALQGEVRAVGPSLASPSEIRRTLGPTAHPGQLVPVRVLLDQSFARGEPLPRIVCASTIITESRRIIQLIVP